VRQYLILDGYNVINGWDKMQDIAKVSLDGAREALIDEMAEYGKFKGIDIMIVFDAYRIKGEKNRKEIIKGVKVVFTKEKETADSYIESLIKDLAKGRNKVSVVTNDWAEQQIILGSGGTRITVRELVLDLQLAKGKIRSSKNVQKKITSNTIQSNMDREILRKLEKFRKE